jgi:hypothetical protein
MDKNKNNLVLKFGGWILCIVSIFLSFLLFVNISSDTTDKFIWGGAAIGIELIKFSLVPMATYYFVEKSIGQGILATFGIIILMALSMAASVGSLSKSSSENDTPYHAAMEEKKRYEKVVSRLETTIDARSVSIGIFQSEKLLTNKANPLQEKNDADLLEIKRINDVISLIVIPNRSVLAGSIASLANLMTVSDKRAGAILFAGFSIVIDVFAVVSLILSELTSIALKKKIQKGDEDIAQIKDDKEREIREYDLRVKEIQLESDKYAKGLASSSENQISYASTSEKVVPIKQNTGSKTDEDIVREAIKGKLIPNPPSIKNLVKNLGMSQKRASDVLEAFIAEVV